MARPITKSELSGFRGATETFELDFDPNKDITMLFGENGSGKSTILDAIDVVCNDTIGCLDGISVGRTPAKYLCTVGKPATALRVTVHSHANSWTGTMRRNAMCVSGDPPRPVAKILRRNCILELVLAQPGQRYEALRHFLSIDVVEQSESTLKQKLTDTRNEITRLTAEKQRMSGQLEHLWEAENRPGPGQSAMEWAESKVTAGIDNLREQLTQLRSIADAIERTSSANETYATRKGSHESLINELNTVEQEIAAAPGVDAASAILLLESLEQAQAYIDAVDDLANCPTCKQPVEYANLQANVASEITELTLLKTLNDRKTNVLSNLNTASTLLAEARDELVEAVRHVESVAHEADIAEITALNIVWPSWDQDEVAGTELVTICDQLARIRANMEQKRDDAQRDVNQFNSINEWWTGITEADTSLLELDRIRDGLDRAHDIVHEKRVDFTQGILNDIREEADRLFQMIHPGEYIGLEKLEMDERRRSSIEQLGTFNGHVDIPPQAVFSESHLDTLGFCVWLALAKRDNPESTILLIDDIFSSVDAAHLGRIIDLLATESRNFLQVIVATHYRLWWDKCQNAQGIQRVHLGQWCAANGIAAQNMPRVLDELREKATDAVLDRQAVSSKAGILLESILDDLSLLYERSLPRNKLNLYTLGALLSACGRLFLRHNLTVRINVTWNDAAQPEDWQAIDCGAAYDRVNALQFIRNQVGCHFNPPGMEIPDDDVREFGTATIAFVESLTCPNCGSLATKIENEGTFRRCSCAKRAVRMTPVATP